MEKNEFLALLNAADEKQVKCIITKIFEYANESTGYLSSFTDYGKGYKRGCEMVHDNVMNIIETGLNCEK